MTFLWFVFSGIGACQVDTKKWGNEKCRCIGLDNVPGAANVSIAGKEPAAFAGQTWRGAARLVFWSVAFFWV